MRNIDLSKWICRLRYGALVAGVGLTQAAQAQDSAESAIPSAILAQAGSTSTRIDRRPKGEWPLPGQNVRFTSQAELPCKIPHAPREVWSYDLGRTQFGSAICADIDDDGEEEILYGAAPLVCTTLSGQEKWRQSCGGILAIADVDDDGHTDLVVGGVTGMSNPSFEATPAIIQGASGELLWHRTGPGIVAGVAGHCQLAKLLPGVKGLQIACVTEDFGTNSKIAQVWSFADGCRRAKLVWERPFAVWEHAGSTVGPYPGGKICLMSPTWGGLFVLDVADGTELMRLYWEGAPGKPGLRSYGPLFVTQLNDDNRPEFVILADSIAQHIDVIAPWRGSPGEHSDALKPWPAPDVPMGELASYADGPNLWRRYYGTAWPQDDFILHFPQQPIVDVDGDGNREIVAVIGKDQWHLTVFDGMAGTVKLSLPVASSSVETCDFDGDGCAEIAAQQGGSLVVGSVRDGRWSERLRLAGGHLCMTARRTDPTPTGQVIRLEQQPVLLGHGKDSTWVATRDQDGDGAADRVAFISSRPNEPFTVSELPVDDALDMRILAATADRLVASTRDGHIRVMSPDGSVQAQWDGGTPFVSQPAVADLDGDGRNELVACKAGGKVIALDPTLDSQAQPLVKWEADGRGLEMGYPAPDPTPLVHDVDRNGEQETLVVANGTQLLDCRGKTIWQSSVSATRATFGDFNGDGHQDIYAAAWAPLKDSIGTTMQSFALDGRDGKVLWRNDGSDKALVWHRQMGPLHRLPTVADVNGDGIDDVLFVAMDLLTALNGKDGKFFFPPAIANEIWKQKEGHDGQWTAYGAQVPIDLDGDGKLEILLAGSWGQWGAWTLDRKLLWTFNPEKSQLAERGCGIADVDGDGKLELGLIHDGGYFRCYDATSGRLKWELTGVRQTSDVVTADVDADGRPEFLAGLAAFQAVDQSTGNLLWQTDASTAHAPVIADLDGNGFCELIQACTDGKIRVYK